MTITWHKIGTVNDFPPDMGSCVKLENQQIAIFRIPFESTEDHWYAVQNLNPYNRRMVLSRGIVGSTEHGPKVACPLHKNPFLLKNGKHLGEGEVDNLKTYPVKINGNEVFLAVP